MTRGRETGQRTLAWRQTGIAICRDCGEGKDNCRPINNVGGQAPYAYCKECEAERNRKRYKDRPRRTKAAPATLIRPETPPRPSALSNALREAKALPPDSGRAEAAMSMGVPEGQLKRCGHCSRWKIGSVDYFEARPRNASGLAADCRVCRDDL